MSSVERVANYRPRTVDGEIDDLIAGGAAAISVEGAQGPEPGCASPLVDRVCSGNGNGHLVRQDS